MYTFLAWLWERASYLYEWFSWRFPGFIQTVETIWESAWDLAQNAYDRAKDWATRLYIEARDRIQGVSDGFGALLVALDSALRRWVDERLAWFSTWVADIRLELRSLVDLVGKAAKAALISYVDTAITILRTYGEAGRTALLSLIYPSWLLYDATKALLTLFTPTNKERLVDFLSRGYVQVHEFFEDPTGFLYEHLETTFVTFLCFVLAHALGTVKADLPKTISWKGD